MALDPFWRNALYCRRNFPLLGMAESATFNGACDYEEEGRQEVPGVLNAIEICPAGGHPARQEAARQGS